MVAAPALEQVEIVVAVGKNADKTLGGFARALSQTSPRLPRQNSESGEAVVWFRQDQQQVLALRLTPGKSARKRHLRKYAQGELPPDRSFYFRGPENKLNLRAQNLQTFGSLAEGVDDDTWLFHLQNGDYSRWVRDAIKDEALATEVEAIEKEQANPRESRSSIQAAIERRYTAAA